MNIQGIENYKNKNLKSIYLVTCSNDYVFKSTNSEFNGILKKEYSRFGEIFPDIDDLYESMEDVSKLSFHDINKYKYFKNKKSAINFINKRNTHEQLMCNWEYDLIEIQYDYIIFDLNDTGVYNTKNNMFIYNALGNHYSSVLIHAWIYLLSNKLIDLDTYKEQVQDVFEDLFDTEEQFSQYLFDKNLDNLKDNKYFNMYLPNVPQELFPVIDKYIDDNLIFKVRDSKQRFESEYDRQYYYQSWSRF